MCPSVPTGLVIHRDPSSWERKEGRGEAGEEGQQAEVAVPHSVLHTCTEQHIPCRRMPGHDPDSLGMAF